MRDSKLSKNHTFQQKSNEINDYKERLLTEFQTDGYDISTSSKTI